MTNRSDIGPFAIVPHDLLVSGISAKSILVWAVLQRHANADDVCWPSIRRIAELCHTGTRQVIRAIAELEQAGWLDVHRRTSADGDAESNLYYVRYTPRGEGGVVTQESLPSDKSTTRVVTNRQHGVVTKRQRNYNQTLNENQMNENLSPLYRCSPLEVWKTSDARRCIGRKPADGRAGNLPMGGHESDRSNGTNPPNGKGGIRPNSAEDVEDIESHFEWFWAVYPERKGTNPKALAKKRFMQLVRQGVDPEALSLTADRYWQAMKRAGMLGTEYVQQAATFLGPQKQTYLDYLEETEEHDG